MKTRIPQGNSHAYLFDCDGTIADSMPLHYIARKQALAEWNCDFEESSGRYISGNGLRQSPPATGPAEN